MFGGGGVPLILPCSVCSRPYQSHDLYWVAIEPPDYIDLPEDGKNVDPGDEEDDPVIRVYYCEGCLDEVELPPLEAESDLDLAPEPYNPGDAA